MVKVTGKFPSMVTVPARTAGHVARDTDLPSYRRRCGRGLRTTILPLDRQAHCFGCKEEGDQPESLGQGKGILPRFSMSTTLLYFASSALQYPCQASMTFVVQGRDHPYGGGLMIAAGRIR